MNVFWLLKYICDHPVNRDRQAGALRDFFQWQVASRLTSKPIRYSWINGSNMLVRHGDNGFTMSIYCGLQDPVEMGYLLHVLGPEDLFVDVGANVGAYTVLAAYARCAQVTCFEPVPEPYARLTENLRVNHLGGRVTALNAGVGERAGRLRFSLEHNCQNHVLPTGDDSPGVEVDVVTLDESLAGHSPALLKIDVEGFELSVLRGATHLLQNPALHSILIEVNEDSDAYGLHKEEVLHLLERNGFSPFSYDPFTRELKPLANRNAVSGNALFIRDSALGQVREKLRAAQLFLVKNVEM